MSWLAQAAAKAEARLTEALNKVDSAAAPALEKAKDRLEETKAQFAEKASELGLGAGGDLQQPRRQVPRPRGEGSGAGDSRAIGVVPSVRAEPKASSDAPTGTVGDDAGRVDAVPEIVPEIVPPPSAPAPASAEPAKKKTQLELLRERRLAREAAAANAKGIVAGLIPDPPTEGTRPGPAERRIPASVRESDPDHAPPPAEHPPNPAKDTAKDTAKEMAGDAEGRPEPEPAARRRTTNQRATEGTPAFAAARERADADLELERRVKRVALLAHARALRTRRAEETRDAEDRADRAIAAREQRAASSARALEVLAARAAAAAAALDAERAAHKLTREDAEERVAAVAQEGGTRARALATEQRRLAEVTARRDDAADEVERLDRNARELRRRIVAANRRRERAEGALAERKKRSDVTGGAGTGTGASDAEAEAAALRESLRRLRDANDAAAGRIASADVSSSSGILPDVSAEDATDQLRLDVAFRTATEALIAEQTRAESLAAARSALVFRLETARRSADETFATKRDGFADEEAGAVESAAAGYRYGSAGVYDDDDDDVLVAGLAETGRYAPKQLAYDIAAKALGGGDRARRVSNLAGAVDALALEGLRAVSRHGGARAAAVVYTCVLHLYMFALVFFGGSGPRATSTATMTAESLYPKP